MGRCNQEVLRYWIRLAENLRNVHGLDKEVVKPVFHVGSVQEVYENKLTGGYRPPPAVIDGPPADSEQPPSSDPEQLPPGENAAA